MTRVRAYLDGMSHLSAVAALDLAPVLGLGTVLGEMTLLLAVAASDIVGIARLGALFGDVVGGVAVAARPRSNVGAL